MDISNMDPETKKGLLALAAQVANSDINAIESPDWADYTLNKGGEKNPKKTIENTMKLLEFYKIKSRYNEMTKETDLDIPGKTFQSDNALNNALTQVDSYANLHGYILKPQTLDNQLTLIGDQNTYHPVVEWIDSSEWDGVDRFEAMLATIETPDPELCKVLFRRWLMNAIAALYMGNGFAAQGVFVMIGAQGLGKTRWLSSLVPNNKWFLSGEDVNTSDKDSVSKLTGRWICELGEIDTTFSKSAISALKAFITKEEDVFRRPFARKDSKQLRRTVFCGSVNDSEFLIDDENRRYWCVEVTKLDNQHDVDIAQFWAQMKHEWINGKEWVNNNLTAEAHWLLPDEMKLLRVSNEGHKAVSPIVEMFESQFGNPYDEDGELIVEKSLIAQLNATEILKDVDINNPSNVQARQLASYLKLKGYKRNKNDKKFHITDASGIPMLRSVASRAATTGTKDAKRHIRGLNNLKEFK